MLKRIKRGFTLIEMLAVIAVIAVLVSVAIPIVSGSTDKAAAATNAANLRNLEGELTTMLLLDPTAFGDQVAKREDLETSIKGEQDLRARIAEINARVQSLQQDEASLTEAVEAAQNTLDGLAATFSLLNLAHPESWTVESIAAERANHSCDWKCWLIDNTVGNLGLPINCKLDVKSQYVRINTELHDTQARVADIQAELQELSDELNSYSGDSQEREDGYRVQLDGLCHFVAQNGYITLENGTQVKAPVSQKVNRGDVNIGKGMEMVVYVDNVNLECYAFYTNEDDVDYSKNDFAAVAGETETE